MSDLGPLCHFLGIEVSCTSYGFFISQEKYIKDLLALLRLRWSSMFTYMLLMVSLCLIQRAIIILLGVLCISLSLIQISPIMSPFRVSSPLLPLWFSTVITFAFYDIFMGLSLSLSLSPCVIPVLQGIFCLFTTHVCVYILAFVPWKYNLHTPTSFITP